jgi:hypothetical protein
MNVLLERKPRRVRRNRIATKQTAEDIHMIEKY